MAAPATIEVFDFIYDTAGNAVARASVTCVLNGTQETTSGGLIGPRQQTTQTNSAGRFAFTVVCNDLLSPANSTYGIITPFRAYDIAPQSANGSSQQTTAPNVIVNTPSPLAPSTSNITGNLSVAGTLTASGLVTAQAGLTVSGGSFAISAGGFSMAGPLTLTAITSQIVPGATSFSVRDTTNANDNLLVSNAGLVTARAGLVATTGGLLVSAGGAIITAGDLAITAGKISMSAAAAQLVPGATSFALRNHANGADNLLVSDAGAVTTRSTLTVTAGGMNVSSGTTTVQALTANGTVSVPDSSFNLRKLKTTAATDRASAAGTWTGAATGGTGFVNLSAPPTVSITPAVVSTLLVFWTVSWSTGGVAGSTNNWRSSLDGASFGTTQTLNVPTSSTGGMSISGVDVFTGVTAAAHTLQLQVQTPAGSTTIAPQGGGLSISVLAIP